MVNKTELIATVAAKAELSKKDAEKVVVAALDTITDVLKNGGKVQIIGFGTFETRKREARIGKNPQTGAAVQIPAANVPVFKAGKALKETVK